ncbi:MAG: type II toxin-antitoxin system VapC family toxin [Candidatus Bathyarchaeota archaeon]|nr:type II toxin-antitoxin system VapC family toxin [Candidatus Bathyarchaeota archaeon]
MILIDSYGWIEYFGEGPLADSYAAFIEKADEKGNVTPTIVIYEVYRKIKGIKGEEKALEAYAQMLRTKIIDLTSSLCLEAADISMNLNLGMADSIVVATAKAYDAQIVTSDEHMRKIDGVKFISK